MIMKKNRKERNCKRYFLSNIHLSVYWPKLAELEKVGRIKLKVVERTGDKLADILHRSDALADEDCCRVDCIMCGSAGEKGKKGICKKRNILYETYCETFEMPVGEEEETGNFPRRKR